MQLSPQQVKLVATSVALASVGGLIHPWSIHVSLARGILTWLVAAIGSGLVLGSTPKLSHSQLLKLAIAPAAALPISYLAFLVVYWLMFSVSSSNIPGTIPWIAGVQVDPVNPRVASLLGVLALVDFATSYAAVALSAVSGSTLVFGLTRLFHFGADGVGKVQKLLIALTTLVLAAIGLWGVLVK